MVFLKTHYEWNHCSSGEKKKALHHISICKRLSGGSAKFLGQFSVDEWDKRTYSYNYIIPNAKHGGGSITVWGYFTLFVIDEAKMIYLVFFFGVNVREMVHFLKQTPSILSTKAGAAAGFHFNQTGRKPNGQFQIKIDSLSRWTQVWL